MITAVCALVLHADEQKNAFPRVEPLKGFGWANFGQIVNSSGYNHPEFSWRHTWVENAFIGFKAGAALSPRLSGAIEMGFNLSPALPKPTDPATVEMLMLDFYVKLFTYLTEANFCFTPWPREHAPLALTIGQFKYRANPYVHNLGEYLLRGTVYPGLLVSGNDKLFYHSLLGAWAHSEALFPLMQDLLVFSELDFKPYYDFSLAYVASAKIASIIDIGAGVNFYRLIPVENRLTNPDDHIARAKGQYRLYSYIDTAAGDTAFYSHRGIKLMARLALDFKPIFSTDIFGENDLVLYSEAALIGVKNYPVYYDTLAHRIPVMVGLNVPTFKLLDRLSVEVEWYGFRYLNDYINTRDHMSPVPKQPDISDSTFDPAADDWKWSVKASRIFQLHFVIEASAANDHSRYSVLNPYFEEQTFTAFTSPDNWYFNLKFGFMF